MSMDYEGVLAWGILLKRFSDEDDDYDIDEDDVWEYDHLRDDDAIGIEILPLGDEDAESILLHPRGAQIAGGWGGDDPTSIEPNDLVVQSDWESKLPEI